ncbi:hypothetical protein S40293_03314 [Stachybotrys chartarum IBT 40293]|nr:hypothetical protein S40293_03314 [Stachybotrys chartarum IBT 40293]
MLFHNHPRLFLYDTLSCLVLPYDISLQETLGAEGIMMEATAPPPPPPPPSHGNSTIPITALHGSFIANQCPSCSYECMAAGPSALSSPYLSLSHRFHAFGYPQPWAWARALRCTDGRVASSAFLPVAARVRLCNISNQAGPGLLDYPLVSSSALHLLFLFLLFLDSTYPCLATHHYSAQRVLRQAPDVDSPRRLVPVPVLGRSHHFLLHTPPSFFRIEPKAGPLRRDYDSTKSFLLLQPDLDPNARFPAQAPCGLPGYTLRRQQLSIDVFAGTSLLPENQGTRAPWALRPRTCADQVRAAYCESGTTAAVDLAALLKRSDSNESSFAHHREIRPAFAPTLINPAPHSRKVAQKPLIGALNPLPGGRRSMPTHAGDQPAKKQSKWSPEEDALIIELRGSGMKWEDISKRLPGRSAISCRLHYQNYLERRSEWDEDRKNKLARLYERFKAEMWAKVAEELAVPWRAAEAMHWQLGEADMARRAGVTPFSLAAVTIESGQRNSPSRTSHGQIPPHTAMPRDLASQSPHNIYATTPTMVSVSSGRAVHSRRDALPPPSSAPPTLVTDLGDTYYSAGPGLAPIHSQPQPRSAGLLPGVAELTTGVSPYTTPPSIHSAPMQGPGVNSGPVFPPAIPYASPESTRAKRRASPDMTYHELSQKRRIE